MTNLEKVLLEVAHDVMRLKLPRELQLAAKYASSKELKESSSK